MIIERDGFYAVTGDDVGPVSVAHQARLEAEASADADKYIHAAELFEQLGMMLAARRCRDRAEYYLAQIPCTCPLCHDENIEYCDICSSEVNDG